MEIEDRDGFQEGRPNQADVSHAFRLPLRTDSGPLFPFRRPGRYASAMDSNRILLAGLAAATLLTTGWVIALPPGGHAPARLADLPWRTLSSLAFERWLLEEWTPGRSADLSPADFDELSTSLDQDPRTATRAALMFAHSADPRAVDRLLVQLEKRNLHEERADDSGDCTAAAALGRIATPDQAGDRLVALAMGAAPHPDLEVRTECALAALELGRRDVVPFLLRVLRIDTPSAEREGRLTHSETTAWPRGRAAKALHDLAGRPYFERTDASVDEREALADQLEALLQP